MRILGEDLIAFRDGGAGRDCSFPVAVTAAPRLSTAASNSADCAAAITVGFMTSKATF